MKIVAHFLYGNSITFEDAEILDGPQHWTIKSGDKKVLIASQMLVLEEDVKKATEE